MAEQTFAQSIDLDSEEWSGESYSESDSDYELAIQDISEPVQLNKPEGATQIDQGHAIATHRKLIKRDNGQIINVNVTANIYLRDGLPALTAEQHKELASNNNSSGHTNNLNLDLGQYGSVQISLPVSSPAKATSKCSCMRSEVQSQDIQNLPDAVRRASSERNHLLKRPFRQKTHPDEATKTHHGSDVWSLDHSCAAKHSDVSQTVSEFQAKGDSWEKTDNASSKLWTPGNQHSGVRKEPVETDISFTKISEEVFSEHPRTDQINSEEAQTTKPSNKTTGAWICSAEGVIYRPQFNGSDVTIRALASAGRYLASKLGSYFMKQK